MARKAHTYRLAATTTDIHPEHGEFTAVRVACTCGWDDDVAASTAVKARKAAHDAGADHVWLAQGGANIVARRLGQVGR